MSIDNEWLLFLQNNNENNNNDEIHDKKKCNINEFDNEFDNDFHNEFDNQIYNRNIIQSKLEIPVCGDIYISTQTKIVNLNINIDIYDIFWKLKLIDYNLQKEGIIKKQIKISSFNKDDTKNINEKLVNEQYYKIYDINFIDNPNGIIKYKYIRKISIGYSFIYWV